MWWVINRNISTLETGRKYELILQGEHTKLQERIKEFEVELEQYRWVPVSERLPKSPTQYLCCYSPYSGELPQTYFATTWSKAKGFFLEDGTRVYPTHWKPVILPRKDK